MIDTPAVALPLGGRVRARRIRRYLAKLAHGVTTFEQYESALNRVWRYYEHISPEDQLVMRAYMMRITLQYHRNEAKPMVPGAPHLPDDSGP